jgi:hypothetical protein
MSVDRGKGWLACACWVLAGAAAAAGTAQPTLSKLTAVDVVRANVELEWASFRAHDKRAYGELLAEEYRGVEVDSQGTRDKTQAIQEVERSLVNDFQLSRLKVVPLGTEAALATYEVFIQFPPGAQVRSLRVYVSEVWVDRSGQWRALHYQETRVK